MRQPRDVVGRVVATEAGPVLQVQAGEGEDLAAAIRAVLWAVRDIAAPPLAMRLLERHLRALGELARMKAAGLMVAPVSEVGQPDDPTRFAWVVADVAAERWGISPRTVRRRCSSGEIPAVELPGGQWLIHEQTIEQLEDDHGTAA